MTRTPPKAFTMGYAAPCGRTVPFKLARLADGSHVFLFLEIALSLGYENPAKMVPDCDAAHALRRVAVRDHLRQSAACASLRDPGRAVHLYPSLTYGQPARTRSEPR
jgi:hypothetical protein